MHSSCNEGKYLFAERFIKTLKNKIYKYMTSISNNVYIDNLDGTINECNNTYRWTVKIKPIDVKTSTYINFEVENNDKYTKFKVGDHVRISKYRNIFAKSYTPNFSSEAFMIKKVKSTVTWTFII